MKHKIDFTDECPECKKIREGISLHFESKDPVMQSESIYDKLVELKKLVNKLNKLNKEVVDLVNKHKEH